MKYIPIISPRSGYIKPSLGDGWWLRETDNGITPGLGGGGIEGYGG